MPRVVLLAFACHTLLAACGGVRDNSAGDATTKMRVPEAGADARGDSDAHPDATVDAARDAGAPSEASTDAICSVDAGPSPLTTPFCFRGGWCAAEPLPFPQRINGVWGSAANDVWLVGDYGSILHWDGSAWSLATSGTSEPLASAWGSGPSDVWAVGLSGAATHWDGTAWTVTDTGTTADFTSVGGTSPTDAWAVGGEGTIVRWNGTSWTASPSGTTAGLNGVWASSPDNAWVVGEVSALDAAVLLHWTGSAWETVESGTKEALVGIWGTGPSDIWVGASTTVCCRSIALHYDGTKWSTIIVSPNFKKPHHPPVNLGIASFWGAAPNDVYGAGSILGHWDGSKWDVVTSAFPAEADGDHIRTGPNQISGTGASDIWGVGLRGTTQDGPPPVATFHYDGCRWLSESTYSGLIFHHAGYSTPQNEALWADSPTDIWTGGAGFTLHWDGYVWQRHPMPGGAIDALLDVAGIWGSGPKDVWAVGSVTDDEYLHTHVYGVNAHWDGSSWHRSATVDPDLFGRAAWGSAANDVWVVGEAKPHPADAGPNPPTIEHWNGSAWSPLAASTSVTLNGLWGSGAADVWAVGDLGTILHSTGKTWVAVTSPVTTELDAVWGTSSTNAWAVGTGGTILHWDGSSWAVSPSGTTLPLTSVGGTGTSDVWVGMVPTAPGDAQLLHWNGSAWSAAPPVWGTISVIAGLPSGDVWAAGTANQVPTVFHRKD